MASINYLPTESVLDMESMEYKVGKKVVEVKVAANTNPVLANIASKVAVNTHQPWRDMSGDDMSMDSDDDQQLFEDIIPGKDISVGKKIGEGAFGSVFVAMLYGQQVAVKRFKVKESNKEEIINEVRVMRTLRHPNIVVYLGVMNMRGELAIVSEFLEGGTLEDLFDSLHKQKKQMRLKRSIKFMKDILRGVCWLYARGIIHRDLKPTNILLDEDQNKCKIADFGLAHIKTSKRTSGHYGLAGTMCYSAPEVLSRQKYGVSADLFSFAIIATELLDSKSLAFYDEIPTNVFSDEIVKGVRPKIPQKSPPEIQKLLKEWHKDWKKRPTAMQAFNRLVKIGVTLDSKSLLNPAEAVLDILDSIPKHARKLFEDQSTLIMKLKADLKMQTEKLIKITSEAKTMEAQLTVMRGMGAIIDKSSGLPAIISSIQPTSDSKTSSATTTSGVT